MRFNREGWGICAAEQYVVTSDGSSELVRRDPQTLTPQDVIHVRCRGRRVLGLNDLAWSAGTIWANVAGTHVLAGIDPDHGEVTDIVNAGPAAERHPWGPSSDHERDRRVARGRRVPAYREGLAFDPPRAAEAGSRRSRPAPPAGRLGRLTRKKTGRTGLSV